MSCTLFEEAKNGKPRLKALKHRKSTKSPKKHNKSLPTGTGFTTVASALSLTDKITMMGLGYLGSSSSSNLSPLAPPFTVDRSNHNKPDFNSNPDSHFSHPSYGLPFDSSWPYPHSSTATQEFLPHSSTTTSALPSNDYGYIIPDPTNTPTTHNWSANHVTPTPSHWPAANPSPKPFSYNLSEAKPFYPPYAASVHNDDVPLVSISEPSYELLSTSGLVHGDQSSQDDYTRSLSGLEYNPHQEGVWSGLPHGKQGRKRESDSLFSEEANMNFAASIAYNNYVNQGVYGAEALNKGKDDTSLFYYAADTIRRDNIGPSINAKSDGTSFSASSQRLDPNEFSKGGSTFRAFPMFSESHPLIQSSEPPEEAWNSQKSYTPFEKSFHMFDCSDDRMSTPIQKSSSLVIKPPVTVSKSLEIGNIAALNISDDVGSHKPLKEKELHLPQGSESSGSFLAPYQLSFQVGRTDEDAFVAASSTNKNMSTMPSSNDQLSFEFKARSSFQVPDINIPNVSTTENVKSAASSFENFDHHNPAEDSPCWKGAPASHPFGAPEAESPQPPTKKLQTGNGVDLQGSQTDYSFNNSSRVHEISKSDEKTVVSIPVEKEHTGEAVSVGFSPAKVSSGGRAQSVHVTTRSKKGHGFSTGDANSEVCKPKLPNLEEDVISPETRTQFTYGDVDHAIHAIEHVLVSDAANPATANKVNASIIVKALNSLSDLLLLHCSNDEFALKDHDRKALDHVISNLDVCMSREVQVSSKQPQQNASNTSQKGVYRGKSQVMNENAGIFHNDQAGQRRIYDDFGNNGENLWGCFSIGDGTNLLQDHNMVQAIKKVLDENLGHKVGLLPESLMYKNLWLEAEAELCSTNYRARFERMKRDSETGKSDKATDASASSAAMGEISSQGSTDLNIYPKPIIPKAGSSKVSNSHIDDVEASVMARFNILKQRGEPNPVNVEGQEPADDIASEGSGVTVQHHVGIGKDNVDPWVKGRLNILKSRGETSGVKEEEEVASGSGSDWEHIRKDEYSWQSNGRGRW